jgi:hypothetical protein
MLFPQALTCTWTPYFHDAYAQVDLADDNKGYCFELVPPVPVTILNGDVRGNARSSGARCR